MKARARWIVVLGALVACTFAGSLHADVRADGIWRDVAEASIPRSGERLVVPRSYRTLALDDAALAARLAAAPQEGAVVGDLAETVISLPLPDGRNGRFRLEDASIMAPELMEEFPEIRTYRAFGIDDPTAYARLDRTPQGFHGMILSAAETVYIDPYARGSTRFYISYFKNEYSRADNSEWSCGFSEANGVLGDALVPARSSSRGTPQSVANGTELRTYRLAVAATGEYTQKVGDGTVSGGMAAIVTAMNRVNGIYERDVAIRMVLVANNEDIVYTSTNETNDGAAVNYSNNSGFLMLNQNQTNLDSEIGNANYDIGHVFSTGGGGVAMLQVPCVTGSKARGVTGLGNPIGDPFYVDYVAHEMGHQWGATHTFNGSTGSCSGGNRTASTAYEPGSGTTIMAYAGICGAQNLQANSDDHFHVASYDQIRAFSRTGGGDACDASTPTGNTPPTPIMPDTSSVTVPTGTPFELCGSATDPNHAGLTYGWEEFDLGPAGAPTAPVGTAPLFRSFSPSSNPCRTFPKLSDLLGNTTTLGEILPSYERGLTFRMTVRDNMANGGGGDYGQVAFTVDGASGPFLVTLPNTAVSWTGLATETVGWSVAGTNGYCSEVDVLLSTDGGLTFPTVLAAGTANDGAVFVTPPNVTTSTARIKVRCSDSIFFDLSNEDFSIVAGCPSSLSVDTDPPAGPTTYAATDTVGFSTGVTIGVSSDVVARAGTLVRLDDGVTVAGSFEAELTVTPCP